MKATHLAALLATATITLPAAAQTAQGGVETPGAPNDTTEAATRRRNRASPATSS
ncbi:hypothetical protein AB5I41_03310 [Sphingomonas sp. MMS24-JH45]